MIEMEARISRKQNQATLCVAHLKGALGPMICQQPPFASPTSNIVNKMRLDYNESERTIVGSRSGHSYLRYYLNYKKSGRPEHVMFYNNGEWFHYPKDVVDLVKNDYKIKKTIVEICLNGHDLMLDFLHMCQVDLKTGFQQPIAWIDEARGCFFPEVYVASNEESYIFEQEDMKLHIEIKVNGVDEIKLRECSGESNALVKDSQVNVVNRMNRMDCGYAGEIGLVSYIESIHGKLGLGFIRELFLDGMSSFSSTDFEIVETYHCSGASMQARLELFQTQVGITKEIHGDANVRYAWLPFSERELSTMVECGLGYCMLSATNCTYGTGVLLAVVTCPYASARYCDIDKNGVRHLVLCRVIMGNMELLHPSIGTETRQFQPISSKYDNGVDDIQSPKYYIVWNMNINTHIYPEFIVSFKVHEDANGYFCEMVGDKNLFGANSYGHGSSALLESASLVDNGITSSRVSSTPNIPKSPWLPFPMLIAALNDKVDANGMSLIREHYELYKVKQISRDDLVKLLRLVVGDTVLRATITSLQFKIP